MVSIADSCGGCWIKWVSARKCVETALFSILINEASTGFFRNSNGLRQGDPRSAFLFTILMDGLSCLLKEAESNGKFFTYNVGPTKTLSRLIFTDDVFLFNEATEKSLKQVCDISKKFRDISGPRLNVIKSCIYLSKSCERHKERLGRKTRITRGNLPTKYIGFPLIGGNIIN